MKQIVLLFSTVFLTVIKHQRVARMAEVLIWMAVLPIPLFNIVYLMKTRERDIASSNIYMQAPGMTIFSGLISVLMMVLFRTQEPAYIYGIVRATRISFIIAWFIIIQYIIPK